MKTCFKCNRLLSLDEFYRHPMMADGHLGKCKDCTKEDVRKRYYDKHVQVMEYEHKRLDDPERREKQRAYAKTKRGTPSDVASRLRWNSLNAHKRRAHGAVSRAILNGALVRQPCEVCGDTNSQGHHEDYSKPLDVVWLCPMHHGERHRKAG